MARSKLRYVLKGFLRNKYFFVRREQWVAFAEDARPLSGLNDDTVHTLFTESVVYYTRHNSCVAAGVLKYFFMRAQ